MNGVIQEVTHTDNIDLKSRIIKSFARIRIDTAGLALELATEELAQLGTQSGPKRFSRIFVRNNRYNFELRTVYENSSVLEQHLLSAGDEGIRAYHIKRFEQADDKLFRYDGILTREKVTYDGVSQDDGVAEVLLGERKVSQQPN